MTERDEALMEAVCTAWRQRDASGAIEFHPAWHDLDGAGRREAYERALQQRALEQALDEDGLSTTARAVLRRIGA
jgi:hypothetical protein